MSDVLMIMREVMLAVDDWWYLWWSKAFFNGKGFVMLWDQAA
jgi:hypothetical protein